MKQGVRSQHVMHIWRTACAAAGLDAEDPKFMSEMLAVLSLVLCTPWSWTDAPARAKSTASSPAAAAALRSGTSWGRSSSRAEAAGGRGGSSPSSVLPHFKGHVSTLHGILKGMAAAVAWLPAVLDYLFPPGRGYVDSPLLGAAMVIEETRGMQAEEEEEPEAEEEDLGALHGDAAPSLPVGRLDPQSALQPAAKVVAPLTPLPPMQPVNTGLGLDLPGLSIARGQPQPRSWAGRRPIPDSPTVSTVVHLGSSPAFPSSLQQQQQQQQGGRGHAPQQLQQYEVQVYRPSLLSRWLCCHVGG